MTPSDIDALLEELQASQKAHDVDARLALHYYQECKRLKAIIKTQVTEHQPDVTFVEHYGNREANCWEAGRQEYENCVFSAGLVSGIEPDNFYLMLEREGIPTLLFLRQDEAQAIITLLSGALWSSEIRNMDVSP